MKWWDLSLLSRVAQKKKVKVRYLYGLLFYLERLKMSLVWLSEMRNSGINKV